ncbi:hypothetical protein HDU98_003613 [Podochytrium sp. JEL0797]|nr:hypothetical protein HDU98_003613 [Podochytrium sp. JEL0797]
MSFTDFSIEKINNKGTLNFADLKGKTVLCVNVASKCGYTKHYAGLEALNQKYASKGLVIIGFPCNQFGGQEPGTEAEVVEFCSRTYNVTFDLTTKIEVNGANTHPIYQFLKSKTDGADIQWNFVKFLVNKDGVVTRYTHKTAPEELDDVIAKLL